jgi:hypothetical protein
MVPRRRVIALAMSEEEIETLTALSQSRAEPARRVSRSAILLAYRDNPSFLPWDEGLAFIIRRSSAVSSGPKAMVCLQHSTTGRGRAKSR